MNKVILSLRNLTKSYYGVPAIEDISFDIYSGEIFGLVGENGAGKSTLIKTIAGAIASNGGEIYFKGEKLESKSPAPAKEKRIADV